VQTNAQNFIKHGWPEGGIKMAEPNPFDKICPPKVGAIKQLTARNKISHFLTKD
jgi:hypothetical protein